MIFLLGGTSEGRELALRIAAAGYPVLLSVATDYGADIADAAGVSLTITGRLDALAMKKKLQEKEVTAVVDATHPFARSVTLTARHACIELGIPYIRYLRPGLVDSEHPLVHYAQDYEQAAGMAVMLGKRVFSTLGAARLGSIADIIHQAGGHLVVRILPDAQSITKCLSLGIAGKDIIAMQGPFTQALNREMYLAYGAEVVLTKESGSVGGTDTKLKAALACGIPIVMIRRPPQEPDAVCGYDDIINWIKGML